jgi:hypothetical protein
VGPEFVEEAAYGTGREGGHDVSEDQKIVKEVTLLILGELILEMLYTVQGSID